MTIRSQYKAALKHPQAEELLDLLVFRPLAFVVTMALVPTRVTPNQITAAALAAALAAAAALTTGTEGGFVAAAVLYALSNVLDCSDGMVARIKRNGTELGRMIDVFADCASATMIYVGLGVGLSRADAGLPLEPWIIVVAAGLSYAAQAALFDRERNRFLAAVRGDDRAIENEAGAVERTIADRPTSGTARSLLARAYATYMRWQGRGAIASDARAARRLRRWSLVGSTTHVTVFAVAMLAHEPAILFGYTIVAANLWCAALLLAHRRSGGAPSEPAAPAAGIVAVILAAGTGSRLRPLTEEVPKPLLAIDGRTLLGRSIDALYDAGIDRFIVVAGYRAAQVEAFLDDEYGDLDIELVYNKSYRTSNNAASLLTVARALDEERLLLLDGDLVYDPSIVAELVERAGEGNALVVRRTAELSEEEVKVEIDRDGSVTRIGKDVPVRRSAGESIGIALFDTGTTRRLFATLKRRMRSEAGAHEFYEAAFQQMIDEGVVVAALDAADRFCIEVDTAEDFATASRTLALT